MGKSTINGHVHLVCGSQEVDPYSSRHSPVGESGAVLISGSKESSAKACKNH